MLFTFLSISNGYSQSGAALHFDGIDDRVSMPNQPVSNLTNFTLEAWVNTSDNNAQAIYSEGNSSDDNPMFSLIKMPNTSGFEIVLRNEFGTGLVVSSTTGYVPLNTWTHVVFTRTSATTASLYINGVNTDSFIFADPGNIIVNVANIGVRQRVNFDGFFSGSIDEVRVWNRTLALAEIANNMNCELGASQTGLLGYYKFNQGIDNADNSATTTLTDTSGNTNTGTLYDFTLTGATSNWVASGGVTTGSQCTTASSLNFDGIDDKVVIGNTMNTILASLNTITVEAWVNPTNTTFNGVIIGNYHNSTNTEMQFLLRRDFDTFTFWVNDGTGFKVVDSGLASVTINSWQHVAGVWDGSSLYIYVDGVLKGITTGVTGSSFASTNNSIAIGSNSYPEHFTGSIDEVRIWNRALNQCEIENNINGELLAGQTGLLAYYQFNQGIASEDNTAITSLTDSSGNNYNGTLTNFALTGTTSNWVSLGGIITNSVSPTYNTPNVNAVTSQSVCNNSLTTPFIFSSSTTGTLCGETNEGGTITLTAPVGAVFTSIPFASYGTPNGTCGNYTFGGCHASNSSSVVSALAIGQNNFSILANNGTFGDPCAFTAKRMYIEAVYNNTTFNWTNDTPSIGLSASGTGSIPSFNAVNTGSTPVVATITITPMIEGCAGAPIQFTITVNPTVATPTGSSTQVINEGVAADATIEDIVVNPTTVIWYASSSDALAGTNALPAGSQLIDGAEYFAVNQENGCSSTPFAVTVTVTLGNDTFDSVNFNLYPNPTSGVITLLYSKEITELSVFNLLGQTMLNKKLNSTEATIDLSSLPSATYFVKVISEGKIKMVKVIKR